MWKRYLMSFSAIMLAFTLGMFSTGCEDPEEVPPPQQPQEWSPPREQPQQPQEPAYPREQDDDQGADRMRQLGEEGPRTDRMTLSLWPVPDAGRGHSTRNQAGQRYRRSKVL